MCVDAHLHSSIDFEWLTLKSVLLFCFDFSFLAGAVVPAIHNSCRLQPLFLAFLAEAEQIILIVLCKPSQK